MLRNPNIYGIFFTGVKRHFIFGIFLKFKKDFFLFYVFFDFSELFHLLEVLLGFFHRGELDINPIETLVLSLVFCRADLSGIVVNVHDRLGNGPDHHLEGRHFQGRGMLDVPDDALGVRGSALPGLGHANGIHRIAGLVLGVPGLGGGQGEHAGHPFCFWKLEGCEMFFGTLGTYFWGTYSPLGPRGKTTISFFRRGQTTLALGRF